MRTPVTTAAALLQALRSGAGYGLELIRRVRSVSNGQVRLSEARTYSTLKALKRLGLVTASHVTPGGRRGARSRTYYDLTLRGVQSSTTDLAALRSLVADAGRGESRASAEQRRRMARRIEQAEDLSAFGRDLRSGMRSRG
jgi:DNA-binding PadR family transcriptional regulator